MTKVLLAAALVGAAVLTASVPAAAQRWHGHHGYRGGWHGYRGGWGWGWGAGAGFAAGALVGGALAARPYYYGYYGPGYYAYEPGPVYGGGAVAYCMRRFKSYDPASGTYLGYDGVRHPCP